MADDIAVLGIEINASQVRAATRDLENLVGAAGAAEGGTRKVETAMSRMQREVQSMLAPLRSLQSLLLTIGAGAAIKGVIELADSYTMINARLRLVTQSSAELATVQSKLFQIAQSTGTAYGATVELYTKMARASDVLGASQGQMLRTTELFSKALQISGASTSEAESALRQFGQTLTKNKVQGDEFNALLENAPAILQFAAKGLGLTTAAIINMGKASQLTGQMLVSGLIKGGSDIDKQFHQIPVTVGRAVQEVKNAFGQYVDRVNQATGSTSSLATAIEGFAEKLSDPQLVDMGVQAINAIAAGMANIASHAPDIREAAGDVGTFIGNITDGWDQLPDVVKEWGIIGGVVLGKRGLVAIAIIGTAIDQVKRGFEGLKNIDKEFEAGSLLKIFTGAAGASGQNAMDAFLAGYKGDLPIDASKTIESLQRLNDAAVRVRLAGEKLGVGLEKVNGDLKSTTQWTTKEGEDLAALVQRIDPARDALVDLVDQTTLLHKAQQARQITSEQELDLEQKAVVAFNLRIEKTDGLTKSVKDQIQSLKDQVAVAGVEATQGKAAAERYRLELQIRRELGIAYGANAAEIEGLIQKLDAWNRKIDENDGVAARAAAQAEAWTEIWKNSIGAIQGAFTSFFTSLFDGGTNVFKSLANVAKQIFGQVLTQAVFGNLLVTMSGIGGAAAGAGGGSGSSAMMSGASGAGGAALFSGGLSKLPVFGQAVLGAGIGALGGGLIGGAMGLNKTGSAIGGGLGGFGALPFVLAGGNPLLALGFFAATTIIGGLLGNLFGGKPSDKLQGASFDTITGAHTSGGATSGAKFDAENRKAADDFIEHVKGLVTLIKNVGGTTNVGKVAIDVGNRSGIDVSVGATGGKFATVDEAWADTIKKMIAGIEGVGPIVKHAFEVVDLVNNPEQAQNLISFARDLEKFLSDNDTTKHVSELQQGFDSLDAQLADFKKNLELIGQSADLADSTIAKLKQGLVDDWLKGLDQMINDLSGKGFLNDIAGVITTIDAMRANALTAGTGMDKVEEVFTLSIRKIAQSIVAAAGSIDKAQPMLDLIKTTFAAFPEVIAALSQLTDPSAVTAAKTVADIEKLVRDNRIKAAQDEISLLRSAQGDIRSRMSGLTSAGNSTDAALLRIATDPNFGNSATSSYGVLSDLFDKTNASARGGDLDAMAKLPDLGIQLLEASRNLNASGAGFFKDKDRVEGALKDQKSLTVRQLEVAQADLAANEAQVALLQQTIDLLQGKNSSAAGPNGGFAASDLDSLNALYKSDHDKAIAGGMSEEQFAGSNTFAGYQGTVSQILGGLNDTGRLLTDYTNAQRQSSDPLYGAAAASRANVIAGRLHELGIDNLPGRAIGGGAGLAFRAHPGEVVFLGNKAQVLTSGQAQDALARGAGNTDRMEQAYRTGMQSLHGVMREQLDKTEELRKELRGVRKELGRIKEKVGAD
jgi:tape measure domain-containing protein